MMFPTLHKHTHKHIHMHTLYMGTDTTSTSYNNNNIITYIYIYILYTFIGRRPECRFFVQRKGSMGTDMCFFGIWCVKPLPHYSLMKMIVNFAVTRRTITILLFEWYFPDLRELLSQSFNFAFDSCERAWKQNKKTNINLIPKKSQDLQWFLNEQNWDQFLFKHWLYIAW